MYHLLGPVWLNSRNLAITVIWPDETVSYRIKSVSDGVGYLR
ncbi:hypothetical protein THF1C08_70152 [Vibrio jasicida]|uniref:ASPIC/UnbV domain-containing protein n=1 Tax=Vibrio jasicida TaxID=766224 RepID=A0AAU9QW26_9VIBR|nr:hypothetical protein THF1C08_70152 [Vibrio jasicida]CAH1602723.1 hypothetical protein THF1A12_60154 [Vibrio jasicida]